MFTGTACTRVCVTLYDAHEDRAFSIYTGVYVSGGRCVDAGMLEKDETERSVRVVFVFGFVFGSMCVCVPVCVRIWEMGPGRHL